MDLGNPMTRTSHRSGQGVLSHRCLRKASAADTVITGLGGSAGIADVFGSQFHRVPSVPYDTGKGGLDFLLHFLIQGACEEIVFSAVEQRRIDGRTVGQSWRHPSPPL